MSSISNPNDVAERMYSLAEAYSQSASTLSQKFGQDHGSATTLLYVVAFEIMLKCCVLVETGERPSGHCYHKIWAKIPDATRQKVLATASHRNAGHIDITDIKTVLNGLERVFKIGRYNYELNDGRTKDESAIAGRDWVEAGALPDDADILFYPMERDGLYFGLKRVVEDHLK